LTARPSARPSPPFPYTTLFRSIVPISTSSGVTTIAICSDDLIRFWMACCRVESGARRVWRHGSGDCDAGLVVRVFPEDRKRISRSEEHTSELQSLRHLVCRLLL